MILFHDTQKWCNINWTKKFQPSVHFSIHPWFDTNWNDLESNSRSHSTSLPPLHPSLFFFRRETSDTIVTLESSCQIGGDTLESKGVSLHEASALCRALWSVNRAWLTNPVETDRGTVKEAVPVWEKRSPFSRRQYIHFDKSHSIPLSPRTNIGRSARDKRETLNSKLS